MKTFIVRPHQLILRDLLCLILVAGVGVAFWWEHHKTAQLAVKLAADLERSQLQYQRFEAELQATVSELAEAQSELTALEPPILKRVEELKKIAFESDHGHLGCGFGRIKIVNSQREVITADCGLDPVHVFGKQVDITDVIALLQSRIKSNRSGKRGPMSSGASSLCHISCLTLSLSKDAAAIPVMKELVLSERNPQVQRGAAQYLLQMGNDESLRLEIEQIHFPKEVKRYLVEPPNWVCFR